MYVTTAELSWHMQNCNPIGSLLYTWGQQGFVQYVDYELFVNWVDIVIPISFCNRNPPWAMKLTIHSAVLTLHQVMFATTNKDRIK